MIMSGNEACGLCLYTFQRNSLCQCRVRDWLSPELNDFVCPTVRIKIPLLTVNTRVLLHLKKYILMSISCFIVTVLIQHMLLSWHINDFDDSEFLIVGWCGLWRVALKIHISGECKKYLDDLGGWIIERRGIIDIKVGWLIDWLIELWFYVPLDTK